MKTKFLFLIALILLQTLQVSAQTQNNLVSIPPMYFTPGDAPIPLPTQWPGYFAGSDYIWGYNGQPAQNNHNAMQDAQGNLLFFMVDNHVYDKNGIYINGIISAQEICIVPDPGNCQRYYLFFSDQGENPKPYYSILDMSVTYTYSNGVQRNGEFVTINGTTLFPIAPMIPNFYSWFRLRPGFAASKLRADNSRFVFIHDGSASLYRFKITSTGLQYENTIYTNGTEVSGQRAEVELVQLNSGNYRIACYAHNFGLGNSVFYADLDPNGNLIPGTSKNYYFNHSGTNSIRVFGLEFSPNGNYLYMTHAVNTNHPNPIEYINVATNVATPLIVSNASQFATSQIELGKDGKIYFPFNNRLATLSNPNTPNAINWNYSAITGINYQLSSDVSGPGTISSYTMPDQIDGMNYTDHFFVNTHCCLMNRGYDQANAPFTTATWSPGAGSNPFGSVSGTVRIQNELVIPAGVTITMYNMRFEFAPGAKVVIERGTPNVVGGGKIHMNNSVFTIDPFCDADLMWLGVQVYGHSNQNQGTNPWATTLQGVLTIGSGGKIEHALKGATAARYSVNNTNPYIHGSLVSGYYGGIIVASGASFLNNVYDVELRSYIAPNGADNISKFTTCSFLTTSLLHDPTRVPIYHAYLAGVKGVKFLGNTFRNTNPYYYSYTQQGGGIYCSTGGMAVLRNCNGTNCTTWTPNLFQDLFRGIYATVNNSSAVYIDYNRFINNFQGITLSSVNDAIMLRNEFQVYRSKAPNQTVGTYGISLSNCTRYKVEENTFTEYHVPAISAGGNTYGVLVSNSGDQHNEIYRNTFNNIRVGCQAQGVNGEHFNYGDTDPSNSGLQFLCNTFNSNIYTADLSITSGRIDYNQGWCNQGVDGPAGNKFSHSTFTSQNDISANSGVLVFWYAHHADYWYTPLYYNTNIVMAPGPCNNPQNILYYDSQLSCPTQITGDEGPEGGLLLLAEAEALSEMITEAQNSPSLLADNIDGDLVSDTGVLQDDIAYLKSKRDEIINEYIRVLISDTLAVNPLETVAAFLQNEEGVARKIQLCDVYLALGQYENATTVRNEIVELGGYNNAVRLLDLKIAANENFGAYLSSLNNSMNESSADLAAEIDNSTLSILQEIANDESDPVNAGKALAYLSVALDTIYPLIIEDLYLDIDVKSLSADDSPANQSLLSIYPNPSDRTVISVELKSTDMNSDMESYIEIYSITGKLVSKKYLIKDNTTIQVDTSDLATGVYVVKLFSNNQLIETKKLMIKG